MVGSSGGHCRAPEEVVFVVFVVFVVAVVVVMVFEVLESCG
jgi:hypothetical protein